MANDGMFVCLPSSFPRLLACLLEDSTLGVGLDGSGCEDQLLLS